MDKHTNQTWQEIEEFFLRDRYMNAQEAKEFGIIDEIRGDSSDIVAFKSTGMNVIL